MRLALINYSSSGMFHYAACLVNELTRRTWLKLLFLTSQYNNLDLLEKRANLQVLAQPAPHDVIGFFKWLASPSQQWRLYQAVARFQPDVIHLTDAHAVCVPHAWWLKRYPIILTQHDPASHLGDIYRWPSYIIHKTQQRLASRIVVHGQHLKDMLVKRELPAQKIAVIPHGDYSFYLRWRNPTIQEKPNSVLFFGRILDYKGLDVLLESLITLEREGLPVTLILAGAGDLAKYQPKLNQLSRKVIDNQTIPENEVIRYFDMSTLIALPYREASQSGIISIALPAGTPIVATHTGALPEILEHEKNALLVAPNSAPDLAAAIKRLLLDSSLRARLGAGGRATVANKISWRLTATQYYQLYAELAAKK